MTWAFVALLLVAAVVLLAVLVTAAGPALLLESHRATEASAEQAPLAHALLADLAPAARIAAPRLYVIPAAPANGFSLFGPRQRVVAITEGAFDELDAAELKGLLALLVASAARPRARVETAIAALALAAAPFVLPAVAMVRAGIRGERWHEVDTAAAAMVGAGAISDTLRKLESQRRAGGGAPVSLVTASLFCVSPLRPPARDWTGRAFTTQPSTEARLAHLGRLPARHDNDNDNDNGDDGPPSTG